MSGQFSNVIRQAFKTFDFANEVNFTANFQALKQLTNLLTYKDFHLNESILQDAAFAREESAPVKYIKVVENEQMTLSVFVLKSGYTMPIHDHPHMHGLVKCIYGELLVQSYTEPLHPYKRINAKTCGIPVRIEEPHRVGWLGECAELAPVDRNYHEITALNGVGAFFDILSPPYSTEMPIYGRRRCRFYAANVEAPLAMKLRWIPAPDTYYCDLSKTPEAVRNAVQMCSEEEAEA